MEMINLQIEIFLLLACGYVLSKRGMISQQTRKQLTSLTLNLLLPASIIKSFELDMTWDILKSCLLVLMASILIQILYAVMMRVFWFKEKDEKKKVVLEYATMVSNAGFMGMPIAESAFGPQGLLYASIFLIPQRICMWSTGLALFTSPSSKKEVIRKVLLHPCIVALGIGVVVMLLSMNGIHLPAALDQTIAALGSCSTAMSMIVIGSILSEVSFEEMKDRQSLVYGIIRTIVLPLMILLISLCFGYTGLGMAVCVLESAMPAPSTVVMLAESYDGAVKFASRLVFVSTILSLITLPIWLTVLIRFV